MNRWLIKTTLKTLSPMRIGTGELVPKGEEGEGSTATILKVGNKPYIPATTLKGLLNHLSPNEYLFGKKEADGNMSESGNMIIYDAIAEKLETTTISSTAIARDTRTAKYGSLREVEYLKVKTEFPVELYIENMSKVDVEAFLSVIPKEFYLGGNKTNGFGKCKFLGFEAHFMDEAALKKFFEGDVKHTIFEELDNHKTSLTVTPFRTSKDKILINLKFNFPFLVSKSNKEEKEKEKETNEKIRKNMPDLIPFEDSEGFHILPASSFRGAMRSQAERIDKTVGGFTASINRLFGADKQSGALQFHDFNFKSGEQVEYNMNAIDRFSGGVSGSALFKIEVFEEAKLTGLITFKGRFTKKDYILLAYLFRDLNEGDITLGYGANKGFGVCEVSNFKDVMDILKEKAK